MQKRVSLDTLSGVPLISLFCVSLDTLGGVPLISFFPVTMPAAFPLTPQLIHVLIHCDLLITAVGS